MQLEYVLECCSFRLSGINILMADKTSEHNLSNKRNPMIATVTYKTDLLRDLDLGNDTTSDIICKACGITNAEGVGA